MAFYGFIWYVYLLSVKKIYYNNSCDLNITAG